MPTRRYGASHPARSGLAPSISWAGSAWERQGLLTLIGESVVIVVGHSLTGNWESARAVGHQRVRQHQLKCLVIEPRPRTERSDIGRASLEIRVDRTRRNVVDLGEGAAAYIREVVNLEIRTDPVEFAPDVFIYSGSRVIVQIEPDGELPTVGSGNSSKDGRYGQRAVASNEDSVDVRWHTYRGNRIITIAFAVVLVILIELLRARGGSRGRSDRCGRLSGGRRGRCSCPSSSGSRR